MHAMQDTATHVTATHATAIAIIAINMEVMDELMQLRDERLQMQLEIIQLCEERNQREMTPLEIMQLRNDGYVYAWMHKGKLYARNYMNEVWNCNADGSIVTTWMGLYLPADDRIDETAEEPIYIDESLL